MYHVYTWAMPSVAATSSADMHDHARIPVGQTRVIVANLRMFLELVVNTGMQFTSGNLRFIS